MSHVGHLDEHGWAVIQGDAVDAMRALADDAVDVVLTDPPYNVGKDYGPGHDDSLSAEDYRGWCVEWFYEAQRVAKHCVAFTPAKAHLAWWLAHGMRLGYDTWIKHSEHRLSVVVWNAPNMSSRNYVGATSGFQTWEPVLVFGTSPVGFDRDSVEVMVSQQRGLTGLHPCPKPLSLYRWLVDRLTEPGMLVLDPFAGSGTTLRAAVDGGRRALGIEVNDEYVTLIGERMAQEVLAL